MTAGKLPIIGEGTNLIYAITVKDVFAFGQLSDLFGQLVIAEADQTAVSIRNRDGSGAVYCRCNQRVSLSHQVE